MMHMVKNIFKIILAGAVSVWILSMISLVYNYSGIHIYNPSGATDYKWQGNQWKSTMTEGFSWFKMDESGFNNFTFATDKPDILLMGSSHMEAVEVAADENTGYLLNKLAPNCKTYNIGISGHTMYNCVNNMKSAVKEYAPSKYVILETDRVDLDIDKMLNVISGEYSRIPSYDSGILYLLQKYVPAVKNIYNAVNEWRNVDTKNTADEATIADDTLNDKKFYYETLNAFLGKAAEDSENKLVIFYQPDTDIDETGSFKDNDDVEYRELFDSVCEKNGIKFIDMTEDFKNLYDTDHILVHGFINTAVGVGHLNKYGHRIIAEKLVKELNLAEG